MQRCRLAILLVSAGFALACSADDQRAAPTAPDVSPRLVSVAGNVCSGQLDRTITQNQRDLFAKPTLDTAKTLWTTVVSACGTDGSAAREQMLAYVRFTILAKIGGRVKASIANPSEAIVDHWDLVFPYVGYAEPGLDSAVLTSRGAAKVILGAEGSTTGTSPVVAAEFGVPNKAAMTFYKQYAAGDQRGHLFTIAPIPAGCLDTNLREAGDCFAFSSFPNVQSPDTSKKFNPAVQVGICFQQPSSSLALPALGHGINNRTELPAPTASSYPSSAYCHSTVTAPQFGGVLGPVKQLAYLAGKLFSVRDAYAAHGGLGGISEQLSPFGPVDRQVFLATFDNDAIGSIPGAPQTGVWDSLYAKPPGSILVQSSLGQLLSKPVVLSQGGGACDGCGGLDLWGRLFSSSTGVYASNGRYLIAWESLQNGPSLKRAPFVVRSSTGAEIARLEYLQQSSNNYLSFNGTQLSVSWIRNVKQRFEITVDLDANPRTVRLDIYDESGLQLSTAAQGFVDTSAADLKWIRAEFGGIDSGIMGWDNIVATRLQGQ